MLSRRWYSNAQDAHQGEACLSGEVTRPDQALRLRRIVPVRAGNRYELEIWARATNRTKLVVWATLPGSGTRTMIASWPDLTRRWQLLRTPISIAQTGLLQLESDCAVILRRTARSNLDG